MTGRAEYGTVVPEVSQADDNAGYMRLYRQRRPEIQQRISQRNNARMAAALIVAKRHPKEFAREIAAEERRRDLL